MPIRVDYQASASEVASGDWFYWGDSNTDGSWRRGVNASNELVLQKRIGGTWTDKSMDD